MRTYSSTFCCTQNPFIYFFNLPFVFISILLYFSVHRYFDKNSICAHFPRQFGMHKNGLFQNSGFVFISLDYFSLKKFYSPFKYACFSRIIKASYNNVYIFFDILLCTFFLDFSDFLFGVFVFFDKLEWFTIIFVLFIIHSIGAYCLFTPYIW